MDVLGGTASVAQLLGTVGLLISKIIDAARTARQNKKQCDHLADRLSVIGDVLPRLLRDHLDDELKRPLWELGKTLDEAHGLVIACHTWSTAMHLIAARHHADNLKDVNARIDSHINLLNLVFSATAGRRPAPANNTPSPGGPAGPVRLSWAAIASATSYFADELCRGSSSEALYYTGRLPFPDGPKVVVKVLHKNGRPEVEGAVVAEVEILFPLRHHHIVRLVGWCSEAEDRMMVYEHAHMINGTLRDHLTRLRKRDRLRVRLQGGSSASSSAVRASWKTRFEVLLGASRGIQHLHGCKVIHRNVSSFNILLDGGWSPRLSGFGDAILQLQAATGDQDVAEVVGTLGYVDPEYGRTLRVSPASDVYSFGMVILEALTGEDPATLQVDAAFLAIRNGKLRDVLDRRPATATPRQLEGLVLVAQTAECCLCHHGKGRPDMIKVVDSLERALTIFNTQRQP